MDRASVCKLLRNDLLTLVVPYLDVATVARLMCASRRSVQELQPVLDVPHLLIHTAEQAANKDVIMKIPGPTLSAWLEKFPVPDINKYSDALLHIPNFPLPLAAALVGAGLRIRYQQFMSVVHAAVRGVQVWVQAYEQLQLPPPVGMSPSAVGLCCGQGVNPMLQVTQADLQDLLHIAIAMPRNGNATTSLSLLCVRPEAQGLEGDACFKFLQAAIKVGASERVEVLLNKLPAAKQLSQDSIIALLHAATRASLSYTVSLLCGLPAAQAVTEATVISLLHTAIPRQGSRIVTVLCQLQATQGLTSSQIAELLHTAVQSKDNQKLEILLRLPAASAIPPATVAALMCRALVAAAEAGPCHQKVAALCDSTGAQGIDSSAVHNLLHTAILRGIAQTVESICQLPAAQGLTASQIAGLLHTAVHTKGGQCVEILVRLPAASAVPAASVAALIPMALAAAAKAGPCQKILSALCGLAGAQGIDSSTVHEVLQTVIPSEGVKTAEAVCQLPAAQGLTASQITGLLQAAVQTKGSQKVEILVQLPAASAISATTIAALTAQALAAAGKAGRCHRKVAAMCGLAGARGIDSSTLHNLLLTAVQLQPEEQQATTWKYLLMQTLKMHT